MTPSEIIKLVSLHTEVDYYQLISKARHAHISQARQIAMYLIDKHTKLRLQAIGDLFNRDHATVMYSIQVVEDAMFMSSDFAFEICGLSDRVGGGSK